jgi:glycosyltransferase involved in cell wall biosynthesis
MRSLLPDSADARPNGSDRGVGQASEAALRSAVTPAISVVVAARNESALLGRCLAALSLQEFSKPYEVIVVDNASNDSTASLASSFACRIVVEEIPGQLLAKHSGVMAAAGDIVAVLDADCEPPPHWLSVIYDSLASAGAENVVAVTGRYRYDPGMPWWGAVYVALMQMILIEAPRVFRNTMPFVIGGNVAFRRRSYEVSGGYPQEGGLAQTELGLARNLNKCGLVKYLSGMEVGSSPRRFETGAIHFFLQYKRREYFDYGAPRMRGRLPVEAQRKGESHDNRRN